MIRKEPMILSFHPCFVGDRQIILGDRRLNSEDLSLIHQADVIILPQSCAFWLYEACKKSSALLFPSYDKRFEYPGKMGQSLLFKEVNSPHPETKRWCSVGEYKKAHPERGRFPHQPPFLIKADKSHEAEGIHLITDEATLEASLNNLILLEKSGFAGFITQELIASGGNVLRVVILGRTFFTYWKRPQNREIIINTISRGAKIDTEWRPDLQKIGKAFAGEFSTNTGINVAAIDFVFPISDPDPQPQFLEVNYYFGRRGLGGSVNYYHLLHEAIKEWLDEKGFDPRSVSLV